MTTINNQLFFSFDQPLGREHFEAEAQKFQKLMGQRFLRVPAEVEPQIGIINKAVSARFPSRGKKESVLKTVAGMNVINVTDSGVSFTPTGLVALAALGKKRGKNMDLPAAKKEAVVQGFDAAFQAYQTAKMEKVVREAEEKRVAELVAQQAFTPTIDEGESESLSSFDDTGLIDLDEVIDDCDVVDVDPEAKTEESIEEVKSEAPKKNRFAWLKGFTSIFSKLFSFLFGWMKKSNKEEAILEPITPEERV